MKQSAFVPLLITIFIGAVFLTGCVSNSERAYSKNIATELQLPGIDPSEPSRKPYLVVDEWPTHLYRVYGGMPVTFNIKPFGPSTFYGYAKWNARKERWEPREGILIRNKNKTVWKGYFSAEGKGSNYKVSTFRGIVPDTSRLTGTSRIVPMSKYGEMYANIDFEQASSGAVTAKVTKVFARGYDYDGEKIRLGEMLDYHYELPSTSFARDIAKFDKTGVIVDHPKYLGYVDDNMSFKNNLYEVSKDLTSDGSSIDSSGLAFMKDSRGNKYLAIVRVAWGKPSIKFKIPKSEINSTLQKGCRGELQAMVLVGSCDPNSLRLPIVAIHPGNKLVDIIQDKDRRYTFYIVKPQWNGPVTKSIFKTIIGGKKTQAQFLRELAQGDDKEGFANNCKQEVKTIENTSRKLVKRQSFDFSKNFKWLGDRMANYWPDTEDKLVIYGRDQNSPVNDLEKVTGEIYRYGNTYENDATAFKSQVQKFQRNGCSTADKKKARRALASIGDIETVHDSIKQFARSVDAKQRPKIQRLQDAIGTARNQQRQAAERARFLAIIGAIEQSGQNYMKERNQQRRFEMELFEMQQQAREATRKRNEKMSRMAIESRKKKQVIATYQPPKCPKGQVYSSKLKKCYKRPKSTTTKQSFNMKHPGYICQDTGVTIRPDQRCPTPQEVASGAWKKKNASVGAKHGNSSTPNQSDRKKRNTEVSNSKINGRNKLAGGSGIKKAPPSTSGNSAELLPQIPDNDGCWNAPNHCAAPKAWWQKKTSSKQFNVYFRNTCSKAIAAHICVGKENGKDDCWTSTIQPGKSGGSWVFHSNGEYAYKIVGATKPLKAERCGQRVPGWGSLSSTD